jgi:hypothetical protein
MQLNMMIADHEVGMQLNKVIADHEVSRTAGVIVVNKLG